MLRKTLVEEEVADNLLTQIARELLGETRTDGDESADRTGGRSKRRVSAAQPKATRS
jgi:hypothetical protein